MDEKKEQWFEQQISRRDMLKLTGFGIGLSVGSSLFGGGVADAMSAVVKPKITTKNVVSFYGTNQPGITTTPVQQHIYFVSLDVRANSKSELQQLFKTWTPLIALMMNGEPIDDSPPNPGTPPIDTGEAIGLNAANLTITVGVGPSLFANSKLGLGSKKPAELKDLPAFPGERLKPEFTGGDICIQACADDPQVAFHAVRNLVRVADRKVTIRWAQAGFNSPPAAGGTTRNLFAFKDGTGNPAVTNVADMNDVVWVQPSESKSWLTNGTYLVYRRIQMHMERWDHSPLKEQEDTFGRHRSSGAPLGKQNEFDPVDINARDQNGRLLMPPNSHVTLAKKANARMLRRSFSYTTGVLRDRAEHDAGLMFISFQKNPNQFIKVQNSLGSIDALNEYTTARGSAIFACFPGVAKGGYLGQALFESL